MSNLPLSGLKVLDLSKVLAGPLCAQYLGDMGADVIKVEARGPGDDTRAWPPFRSAENGDTQVGTVFMSANRNKRSIKLDLKREEAQKAVQALAKQSDIVIESFGPGVARKLGIDAPTLRSLNERIIYCSISGFGSVGPMSTTKGYDVILQAFTGMLSLTGEQGGPPVRSPFSPVDQATGLHALIGILAALHERHRTGKGALIEAALFDTATSFLGYFLQGYWERGTEPQRVGSGHESLCPYQAFETQTAPIILGVANDTLWRAFCQVANLEAYEDDPRFATNAARVDNRNATLELVQSALYTQPREYWIEALNRAGIPCSPLHTLGELSRHEHTSASGMVFEYQHPHLGTTKTVAQPIRFNGQRTTVRRPLPMAGEQTKDILSEAGYSTEEIKNLLSTGVAG